MDQILYGLLSSTQPEQVKRPLLQKIADAGSQQQPVVVIQAVLRIASDLVLEGKSRLEVDAGKNIFYSWGKFNRTALAQFCSSAFLQHLITGKFKHEGNAVWLLHQSLLLLKGVSSFPSLCVLVQAQATAFVVQHPWQDVIIPMCRMLLDVPDCIPQGEHTNKFCVSILHAVATFSAPTDKDGILAYIRDVPNVVGVFLKHIWDNADSGCVMESLQAIFRLISYIESNGLDPSIALGGIVKYLPTHLIGDATNKIVTDTRVKDNALEQALHRMISWLSWPGAMHVDLWIIAFLRALAGVHKYTILIRVTQESVEEVFERLNYPVVRDGALKVLYHMLLSFQHSPEVFHKIAPLIPDMFKSLSTDNAESVKAKLAELCYCLMTLHPGFPEVYDPILDAIQGYPRPAEHYIQSQLATSKWNAQQATPSGSPYLTYLPASTTGKVGLINLGNTCYINSVMQALYMCDSFRKQVLSALPSLKQPLLVKLQYLFAFLWTSQRPAYAPSQFIKAARPPWFEAGQQQDCSEFLKYLLDQLHEQERIRLRDKAEASGSADKLPETLVHRMFGVRMLVSNKCGSCHTQSSHSETFLEIMLPFYHHADGSGDGVKADKKKVKEVLAGGSSSPSKSSKVKDTGAKDSPLSQVETVQLEELIQSFLTPESLSGDNQYHCDKCGCKRDATRSQTIASTPPYLILTLLRFAFDTKTMSRTKVFTDVRYPRVLHLPVGTSDKQAQRDTSSIGPGYQTYALCSVVVHSGMSSESGHYYSYGRHAVPASGTNTNGADVDIFHPKWFLFNDARVSHTTFESFCRVTQRFMRDTAYMLVYRKVEPGWQEDGATVTSLRKDLREAVTKDNMLHLQEQEIAARSKSLRRQEVDNSRNAALWRNWNDKGGGAPPGSCGGGGFSSGPRYVC